MIKYNSNTINDWNYGGDNIIKVYYDNAVCYQKLFKSPVEPQYRTLATATTCVGYDLYTLEEYQVSYDEGETWTTTATSATTLIEHNSADCGYVPPFNEYEYIQTQNGNYKYDFNTNFYPTTANTIELKFTLTGTSQDWGRLLCWSSCNGDRCDSTQFRFTTVTASYAIIGRKGNTSGIQYYVIGNGKTVTVTLPLSSSTYTYNTGSTNTTCDYNVGTFILPSSTPMHIFNLGYASDNRYAANVKLYYVKVYDGNGNLVKHYVPSDSNGTPCLYEIVNGTYILDTWTGSNHGTLTLGPEI